MPKIELEISALAIHVRTARLVAAALGRRLGLDAMVLDEVKLAVGEACSRAVSVHRAAGTTEPIVVAFRDDDDILEISVADRGPSGAQLPEPASGREPHEVAAAAATSLLVDDASLAPGLGLALIAGLVDDMSVDSSTQPAGTVVTMRWPIVNF